MSALASRWQVVAASAVGSSHRENGLPCQDTHAFRVLPGGELCAAVADGAGSAGRSRDGALLAIAAALAGLEALCQVEVPVDEAGWQAAFGSLFGATRQELADFAAAEGVTLNEFATTLTCAMVTAEWLVVGQIGDGAAVAEGIVSADDPDHALFLVAHPQRGEYANEAYFLIQPDAAGCPLVYASRRPVQALALTTDGLLRLAFKLPGYIPHPGFFLPLLTFASEASDLVEAQAELAAFLASERVCARTDDDKTLLLAVRLSPPVGQTVRSRRQRRKDVRI